jgi:hypothetical protein
MYCTTCGSANDHQANFCAACGRPTEVPTAPVAAYQAAGYAPAAAPQPQHTPAAGQPYGYPAAPGASGPFPVAPQAPTDWGPKNVTHWLLPVGRSWQSIVAGYVALLAIVVWPLGPIALGLGGWALWRASNHGTHGRGRAIFALVVGSLATLALLVWQMS